MKLLLISTRFFPYKGGVEEVMERLSHSLIKKGQGVAVLTGMESRFLEVSRPIEEKDGITVKRVWMSLPRNLMGYLAFPVRFVRAVKILLKFVENNKPDLINFHFPDDASLYVWLLTLKFKDIPLVLNIHGNDIISFANKPFYKLFIKKLLIKSKFIIVNSTYMRDEVLKYDSDLKSKTLIISNGLDLDYIASVSEAKIMQKPYIFSVGRLVKKKGYDILIKAFHQASLPDLHLVIEGSGEELSNLKSLVDTLKIQDKVLFTEGKLSHDRKIAYMKGGVFGVMASRNEPFGIVALEFLAAGTPLVASKTGGLVDLLKDNETGLFFENENINDLEAKIKYMFVNSGLRMKISVNGLEAVQKYGWDNIADQYIAVYSKSI